MAVLVLAGCLGDGDSAKTKAPPTSATPNDHAGVVAGLVTDDEARPIEGADVGLRGTQRKTSTDGNGRFELADVPPGGYTLDVARIGFLPQARQIDVKAGARVTLEIRVTPLPPVVEVYYEVSHFTGFYDCALGTVVWVSACSYPYTAAYLTLKENGVPTGPLPPDIQNNTFRYNFTLKAEAVQVVSELEWTPSSPAAQKLQFVLSCADYDPILDDCGRTYAQAEGSSPLRVVWDAKAVSNRPAWVMTRVYLPFESAQVALSQKFDVWNTVFFNGPAPEGFSIVAAES